MKKIFMSIIFLNFIQPAQGMFTKSLKHIVKSNPNKNYCSLSSNKITVSEICYNNWQAIGKDATKLDCYFKGVFEAFGNNNQVKARPSELLKFIRDKSDINNATKLTYMNATDYMDFFITETDYNLLDTLFIEKYNETKNVQLTAHALYDYFSTHLIKKNINAYCKDMLERDAAQVSLAKQGIFITDRTITFNANLMSDKKEDIIAVKNAFDRLMRE